MTRPFSIGFLPDPAKFIQGLAALDERIALTQKQITQEVILEMRNRVRKRLKTSHRTSGQFMPGLAQSTKDRNQYPRYGRMRSSGPVLMDTQAMCRGIKAGRAYRLSARSTVARVKVDRAQSAKVAALSNLTHIPGGRHHRTIQKNREFFGYSKKDIQWAVRYFRLRMGRVISGLLSFRTIASGDI